MAVQVDIETRRSDIVIPSDWVTLAVARTDSTLTGSGTEVLVTVDAAPTPEAVCEMRLKSQSLTTTSTVRTIDQPLAAVRMGPFTVDTGADVALIQARRVSGNGGVMVYRAAVLQGAFDGSDDIAGTLTAIVTQPQSTTVEPGVNAVFTVVAVGDNNTFAWDVDTGGGWTSTGATSPTLIIVNPQAGDSGNLYRVTVDGDVGPAVVSSTATLTVSSTTVTIVTDPTNETVPDGGSTTFTSQATGPAGMSWKWEELNGSWADVPGATGTGSNASLPLGPLGSGDSGRQFRCEFYETANPGNSDTSTTATLTVSAPSGGATVTDIEGGA